MVNLNNNLPVATAGHLYFSAKQNYTTVINGFREAMRSSGIVCNEAIITDGCLHRFHVEGDRVGTKNGWYILHGDEMPAGSFGSWRTGIVTAWSFKSNSDLTISEKTLLKQRMQENKIKQEQARAIAQTQAQIRANEFWGRAQLANKDHPYLLSKGIEPLEIRQLKDSLVVPLLDIDGRLCSLQFISVEGEKRFLQDGAIKGNFCQLGSLSDTLFICEGYATGVTIHKVTAKTAIVAFNKGNLSAVAQAIQSKCPGQKIIIAADNDQFTEENPGVAKANEVAQIINANVVCPDFSGYSLESKPTDFNDLMKLAGVEEVKKQLLGEPPRSVNQGLRAISLGDFLALELPPRELILSPWLPKAGLCMIHARPGIGKTHLSFGVAYAVATGGAFLRWKVEKPRGVLLIDGEMPAVAAQERFARIVQMYPVKELPAPLHFITPDLQELGMPDLATIEGQGLINQYITDDIDLVIVDNLSCLVRTGKENESESWLPIQTWALGLRAKGKSVLFIHHQGKTGSQRGSSKKIDVLDTVIALNRPDNYSPNEGACFNVSFEKARGFHGDEAKPFEARLTADEKGNPCWITRDLEDSTFEKVIALYNEGLKQGEIAQEIGINKSSVSRHIKRATEEGLTKVVRGREP